RTWTRSSRRSVATGTCSPSERGTLARSAAPQAVEVLVELEHSSDRVGLRVGNLDVDDPPAGEGALDVGAARAAGQLASAPRSKAVEDQGGVRCGNGGHLYTHGNALGVVETMERP